MNTRSKVLELLELSKGSVRSGEELANHLGISRAAVWKAVQELKKQGYSVTASTKNGYSLSVESDLLSREGMLPFLKQKELGELLTIERVLDSTNLAAKKMVVEGAPHGTVVLAEEQTAGRGRRGRIFHSPPGGGIYMSVILRTDLPIADSVLITTAASVAVARAIERITGKQAQIKWVNDILINGRKVCGILTEGMTDLESGGMEAVIVGIGINFKRRQSDFPEEIATIAGALFEEETGGISRNQLIAEIINELLELSSQLKDRAYLSEYRDRSFLLGKEILVLRQECQEPALAVDIDQNGGLMIRKQDGTLETLNSGEVSIRPV